MSMRFNVDYNQAPLLVIWETTRSCALACKHCRAEAILGRNPGELNTAEAKSLLDDVRAMGTPIVVFTGGDPLQRPDLEELIAYANAIGLRTGAIPATTPRLTRERLQSIADAGLDQVAFSVDAGSADLHDAFRRVPGAFDKAMQGCAWAREIGIPLQINTVLASWNYDDFDNMVEMVCELGAVFWEVFFLVPMGRGEMMNSCTAEQYEVLFEKLHELSRKVDFVVKVTEAPHYRAHVTQRRRGMTETSASDLTNGIGSAHHRVGGALHSTKQGINSGKGFCFVDHLGNVCPSGFLPIEVGNVRDTSIIDLYRHDPLFVQLRNPQLLEGPCGQCGFADLCGGSRARAYAVTGNVFASEPFCTRADRIRAAQKRRQAVTA